MSEIYSLHLTNRLHQILSQPLILATITTVSLISGTFDFNSQAVAQTFNIKDIEITNYVKAVLEMEPVRQQAFEEIKKIIGSKDIPQVICHDSASLNALPTKAQDIAVNYCNQSQQIVRKFITVERFNEITLEKQKNTTLQKQLYKASLNLQKTSPPRPSK
ncbi:DUF4168 domain-containing protein [Dolichospermum circinale]|uniref:DUF4168 domain-containing protein n=1 Tax=Dolichospermum circinale TaxID=109265 RepID=UPI00040FF7F7|nr:DUF4168 domain-containing protein [Dolichospermum circinale]MDB9452987.1 DUF4168 domain-containing protein [Dolichospermum circinale CS-541/06]MDB9461121.1 DUF4168 domain-containing protein [Dolichospermum circinale CS-541/04]MDB9475765.1 DUF4168 domain-containing protein [Dolichospermum circinale CS-537/11]MDB9479183.1 DUF4168 domain-containing protein [Dolichospermum circinale CS-537/03]MDB9489600.1 DUF4168 domain-containing protein [Dolichospermum circinale CS-534/05]